MKTTLQKTTPTTVEISSLNSTVPSMYDVKINNIDLLLDIAQNRIYTRKIGAFVRETLCNAVDSHNSSKITTSIDINFPTLFDSTFSIRDFGKGLSPEDISNIYFSYGGTTKNTNNKSIGGFGIGCLSPLAYTDHFFIESFYKGKQYCYTIFKSGSPKASVVPTSIMDTTENSGFKVIVPIQNTDYKELEQELILYTSFCICPTNINNNDYIKLSSIKELDGFTNIFSSPNNFLISSTYSYNKLLTNNSIHSVVIGGVPYSFNISQLKDESLKVYNNCYLFLYLPIGSIDIPPARETVEYTEKTIKVLTNKLKELIEDIRLQFSKSQESSKSLLSCRASNNLSKYGNKYSRIYSLIGNSFYFKNRLVSLDTTVLCKHTIYYIYNTSSVLTKVSQQSPKTNKNNVFKGIIDNDVILLYPDIPLNKSENWTNKVREIYKQHPSTTAVIILYISLSTESFKMSYKDTLTNVEFDGYTILKSSDIILNKTAKKAVSASSNVNSEYICRKFRSDGYNYLSRWNSELIKVNSSDMSKKYLGISLFDRNENEKYLKQSSGIHGLSIYLEIMNHKTTYTDVLGILTDTPKMKNVVHYDTVVDEYVRGLNHVQKQTIAKLSLIRDYRSLVNLYIEVSKASPKYKDKNFKNFMDDIGFIIHKESTYCEAFIKNIVKHPDIYDKVSKIENPQQYYKYMDKFFYFRPYLASSNYPMEVPRTEFIQNLVNLTVIPKF